MTMLDSRLRHPGYVKTGTAPASVATPRVTGVPPNIAASASEWKTEVTDVARGRVTLAALNTIILGMVIWYWYTRGIQGGG